VGTKVTDVIVASSADFSDRTGGLATADLTRAVVIRQS
jgi:hypothetical protein